MGSECKWNEDDSSELEDNENEEDDDIDELDVIDEEFKEEESWVWNNLADVSFEELVDDNVEFELDVSVIVELSRADKLGVTIDVTLGLVVCCSLEDDDDDDELRDDNMVVLVEPSRVVEDEVELDILRYR